MLIDQQHQASWMDTSLVLPLFTPNHNQIQPMNLLLRWMEETRHNEPISAVLYLLVVLILDLTLPWVLYLVLDFWPLKDTRKSLLSKNSFNKSAHLNFSITRQSSVVSSLPFTIKNLKLGYHDFASISNTIQIVWYFPKRTTCTETKAKLSSLHCATWSP